MRALKSLLMAGAIAAGLGLASAGPASAADPPLKVKITSFDGKPKIKVAKKLKVGLTCSRDCDISVKGALWMPIGRSSWTASRDVPAGNAWFLTYKLTGFGIRQLRKYFRVSRYIVRAKAIDLETGKKTVKVRNFRFRK